jgi:hypothetical protein
MSRAKDIFYELLTPEIEPLGFSFKKSATKYIKSDNILDYEIYFSWDGRGGLTFLNYVSGMVSMPWIRKSSKLLLGTELDLWYRIPNSFCTYDERIPPMYSKELLDLANSMSFKKMASMPFEEKYPLERIKKSVLACKNIIINEIIPFHNSIISVEQILSHFIEEVKKRIETKDTHNLVSSILKIKLLCKKLGKLEPDFIQEINVFSNKTFDDLWNMQDYEYDKIEERFENLKI